MARVEYHEVTVKELMEAWIQQRQRDGKVPFTCKVSIDSVQAETVSTWFRVDNTITGFTFKLTETV